MGYANICEWLWYQSYSSLIGMFHDISKFSRGWHCSPIADAGMLIAQLQERIKGDRAATIPVKIHAPDSTSFDLP